MPTRALFGVLLVCSTLYGCGGDDDENIVQADRCRPEQTRCDIEQSSCVQSLLELTACIREDDPPPLPDVAHLTADEVVEMLSEMLEEDGTPMASPWDAALRRLRLLPEGSSSIDVAIGQFVDSVAAFYDPGTKGITIITDTRADELSRMYVLSHELTHYLQDREHDLDELREDSRGSTDRQAALSSLVEGDAVVTSTRVLIRLMERSSNNFAWERYFGALEEDMIAQIEASPAPLAEALQDLPYTVGGLAIALRWNASGRDGVDALFEERPRAMTDWLGRWLDPEDSMIEPLECAPPLAPDGFRLYELDSFGAAGAFAMLAADGDSDLELAGALRNDAIALYVAEGAEDPATAPVLAVWRLRFANSTFAESFADSIADASAMLAVSTKGREVTVRVSSNPQASELRGSALDACPKLEDLEPERDSPELPMAWLRHGVRAR